MELIHSSDWQSPGSGKLQLSGSILSLALCLATEECQLIKLDI
jgi:hypothetical protein